jgi:hypothetical protein
VIAMSVVLLVIVLGLVSLALVINTVFVIEYITNRAKRHL